MCMCHHTLEYPAFPQLIADSPRLSTVAKVVLRVTTSAATSSSSISSSNESARVILEGLLAHFFAPQRQHYHTEDIHWFLCQANSQIDWEVGQVEEIRHEVWLIIAKSNAFLTKSCAYTYCL